MNTNILTTSAAIFASLGLFLESASPQQPTRAAELQAVRIVRQYDKMIAGTENQIREMKGFKSRFDVAISKPTRQHRPQQYWFRSPEQKRTEIASLEASLAAMRATRWESAVPASVEATWSELRVDEIALPTDYSTGKPVGIMARAVERDSSGRVDLALTWPKYFAVGNVDASRIYLDGSTVERGQVLKLPLLWVKATVPGPDGDRFVCEFATEDQTTALEREVSRLTHPDRNPRRWKDASVTREIEATLLSYDQKTGSVSLERAGGVEVTLKIDKLSQADRELVELTLGSRVNPRPKLSLTGHDPL